MKRLSRLFQGQGYFSAGTTGFQIPHGLRDLTQLVASVKDWCYLPGLHQLAHEIQVWCVQLCDKGDELLAHEARQDRRRKRMGQKISQSFRARDDTYAIAIQDIQFNVVPRQILHQFALRILRHKGKIARFTSTRIAVCALAVAHNHTANRMLIPSSVVQLLVFFSFSFLVTLGTESKFQRALRCAGLLLPALLVYAEDKQPEDQRDCAEKADGRYVEEQAIPERRV